MPFLTKGLLWRSAKSFLGNLSCDADLGEKHNGEKQWAATHINEASVYVIWARFVWDRPESDSVVVN